MLFELDIVPSRRPRLYHIEGDAYSTLSDDLLDVIGQIADMRGNLMIPVVITRFSDDMTDVFARIDTNMVYVVKWWDDIFILDAPVGVSYSLNSRYEEIGRSYMSSYMIYNIFDFGRKYDYAGDYFTTMGMVFNAFSLNHDQARLNFAKFAELFRDMDDDLLPVDLQWVAASDYMDYKVQEHRRDVSRIREEYGEDYI
jgi:hypothetical protein